MSRSSATAIAAAALAAAFFPVHAFAGAGEALLAHRAVYDLDLKSATDRSGIDSMVGRMVYEFNGSACDGYTTRFRLVTQIMSGGDKRVTDQQTTTYENPRTRTFSFVTRTFLNGEPDKEVRGTAHETDAGTDVELQKPTERHVRLPKSEFPTQHMLDMIRRARAGDTMYQSRIFDGSEDADKAPMTTTVLGKVREPKRDVSDRPQLGNLGSEPFWPASVAYFDAGAKGDETPSYRMAFRLYANGVSGDLTMDYGDFALHGNLVKLEKLRRPDCAR